MLLLNLIISLLNSQILLLVCQFTDSYAKIFICYYDFTIINWLPVFNNSAEFAGHFVQFNDAVFFYGFNFFWQVTGASKLNGIAFLRCQFFDCSKPFKNTAIDLLGDFIGDVVLPYIKVKGLDFWECFRILF